MRIKKKILRFHLFLILQLYLSFIHGQEVNPVPPTTGASRLEHYQRKLRMKDTSLFRNIEFTNIGPSLQGGRVIDVEVDPNDHTHYYIAYASGGLFVTYNNGTSFEPIFDNQAVLTIGDIAVHWKTGHIWVGTGEVNSSRSSYAGVGMYMSKDTGKTWIYKGLEESHHIGRVIIDPENPNRILVAVLGHLYSPNPERGIYTSDDGGAHWERTLYIDENSGGVDLFINPRQSHIIYASTWERWRRSWNFSGTGKGSGIWRSIDSGKTWAKISYSSSGFPDGEKLGRIGIHGGYVQDTFKLYALVDNQFPVKEDATKKKAGLDRDTFKNMTVDAFMKLSDAVLEKYLKDEGFPEKITVKIVRSQVKEKKILPSALLDYVEDASSFLFKTKYKGAELYVSIDDGKSWTKTHTEDLVPFYYGYGYYFGNVRVLPENGNQLYILGFYICASEDGGKNFKNINQENIHVDHHALWVNPKNKNHIICGNDGGVDQSWDGGEHWVKHNTPATGQFYSISVDQKTPYQVYGGLQDNGVWVGPSDYKASASWQMKGEYPYKFIMSGDGMQTAIDPRDNATLYTGYQFGAYYRINQSKGESTSITPVHNLGERPYRFNWQTPIQLSTHNPDILYMGSSRLYRSMNNGKDWKAISPDLTRGGKIGNVAFGTITAFHESSLEFGLIYAGTDDGRVWVTKNNGHTWDSIEIGIPKHVWITRIQASVHDEKTVYLTCSGYRWDDFQPYVYKSNDYGTNWVRICQDLPMEPVNVIKEDPEYAGILYIGTDNGCYISLDDGMHTFHVSKALPHVAVHDLLIKDSDLLLGTHGRSIYKTSIQSVRDCKKHFSENLKILSISNIKFSNDWGTKSGTWGKYREPEIAVSIWTSQNKAGVMQILNEKNEILYQDGVELQRGVNYFTYQGQISVSGMKILNKQVSKDAQLEIKDNQKYYLVAGIYQMKIIQGDVQSIEKFEITVPK